MTPEQEKLLIQINEDFAAHPLVLYSCGQISSAIAVRSLQIRDHAELLVYLGDAGLPIPMPSDEEIAAEIETFKVIMRT